MGGKPDLGGVERAEKSIIELLIRLWSTEKSKWFCLISFRFIFCLRLEHFRIQLESTGTIEHNIHNH